MYDSNGSRIVSGIEPLGLGDMDVNFPRAGKNFLLEHEWEEFIIIFV